MSNHNDFVPWSKYAELTEERLVILGSLVREARESAVRRHDPSLGDGAWGLGCCAYERTCFAIEKASALYDWLEVLPDPEKYLRFTFAIGHIPFRLYRGEPSDPPSRYLATSFAEIRQRQQLLDFGEQIPDGILRIAIETDDSGRACTISVVELNAANDIIGSYTIPSGPQAKVMELRARPIDTAPPKLEPFKKADEAVDHKEREDAAGE